MFVAGSTTEGGLLERVEYAIATNLSTVRPGRIAESNMPAN